MGAARVTTSRSASGSPRGTRRWAGSVSRGGIDYAAIGSVTNLAARLCADAEPWQILVTERVFTAAGPIAVAEDAGIRELRGFSRSIHAFERQGLDNARIAS